MDAQQIIEYIRTSEKKTPVKVYVWEKTPVAFPGCHEFPAGEGCKIDYDAIKLLSERGVCTAVMTDGPLTNASIMVRSVGEAVREGMDPLEALKTITVNAARIIGCEERIGTIEVGKDADIAVFSAQPALDPRAAVVMTIIDGEIVYKRAGR